MVEQSGGDVTPEVCKFGCFSKFVVLTWRTAKTGHDFFRRHGKVTQVGGSHLLSRFMERIGGDRTAIAQPVKDIPGVAQWSIFHLLVLPHHPVIQTDGKLVLTGKIECVEQTKFIGLKRGFTLSTFQWTTDVDAVLPTLNAM